MRHLTFVRSAAVLAVVTLFSACGDDSTGPSYDDTFTSGDVEGAAFSVAFGSDQMMEIMHWGTPDVGFAPPAFLGLASKGVPVRRHPSRFPAPAAGTSFGAYLSGLQAAAPGCAISGHGSDGDAFDPYDGNENGVGDDFLVRIDCTYVDSIGEGVTVLSKEGAELRIKERSGVLWGWDASSKQWYSDKRSDGVDHDEGVEEYTEHMLITATRGEYGQTFHYAENGLDGDVPYDDAEGGAIALAFTPDDDEIEFHELFPPGTVVVTGGFWNTDLEGPNLNWVIHTVDPLTWSPACAMDIGQPFVDGTINVLLNGNSAKGFSLSAGICHDGWDLQIFGQDAVAPATTTLQIRGFTLPKR